MSWSSCPVTGGLVLDRLRGAWRSCQVTVVVLLERALRGKGGLARARWMTLWVLTDVGSVGGGSL